MQFTKQMELQDSSLRNLEFSVEELFQRIEPDLEELEVEESG